MADEMFDKVYATTDPGELRDLYDGWAAEYDADLADQSYATPGRVADALARHSTGAGPILDFGCGTGLSGTALAARGFTPIDGYDVSAGMLDVARGTGLYRELIQGDPGARPPVALSDYAAVTACGAISPGAAPAQSLDDIVDSLTPGALFVVSLNQHALADPDYVERIHAAVADGRAEQLEAHNGPHLQHLELTSTVFVLRRR